MNTVSYFLRNEEVQIGTFLVGQKRTLCTFLGHMTLPKRQTDRQFMFKLERFKTEAALEGGLNSRILGDFSVKVVSIADFSVTFM